MKLIHKQPTIPLVKNTDSLLEEATEIWMQWRRQKLPLYLFLGISINLFIAPLVYAATDGELSRPQSWALGLLVLGVIAISIYLFFVMFVPERF